MSEDQGQVIQEDSHEPSNFAMIPQMAIMELDPYELALYCYYKITARDSGACWKSNAKVALETGMSESKMRQTRLSLITKGYIQLTEQADESGNINTPPVITIVNIWSQNRSKYGVSENRGVAPENTPRATRKQGGSTRKHQSISIELDAGEAEEENTPLPPKRGKRGSIPRKSWERQKFLDYYSEHSEALASVTEAWGYNTRFVDLTTQDMYELAAAWYGLEEIHFNPDNYKSLFSHTHAMLSWKKNLSPLDAVGQVEEWKGRRLEKPIFEIPEGHYDPAKDDGTPATPEQIAAAKAQWAELLKSKNGNTQVKQYVE